MTDTRAPLSICIIVKNEPLLEKCLLSIRDHVKEIVIVDTGSTDGTQEVAKKYADIFDVYTDCNDPDTGLIESFSKARTRSFELATQPWVGWMDADDIIVGGEYFAKLIEKYSDEAQHHAISIIFPYEYSYNENNQCTCTHYRERIFSDKTKFKWVNPVHEVCINSDPNAVFYTEENITYKHQRQYGSKIIESGRNLRILKKYLEITGDSDARQLYYIGLEYYNNGMILESIASLEKYIELSGWDDERAMAALKLVEISLVSNDFNSALKWAFKTVSLKENWCEGYLALGRIFYFLAQKDPPNELKNWNKCVHFIKIGLSLPPTKTLLFVNPLERSYDIHKYYNLALSKIGDIRGAIDSANTGLLTQPDDTNLILNKKIYESALHKSNMMASLSKLRESGELSEPSCDVIHGIVSKQISATNNIPTPKLDNDWNIPSTDFDSLPLNLSVDQLESAIIMLWKQYVLHDEVSGAIKFLETVPNIVRGSEHIQKAIMLTKKAAGIVPATIVEMSRIDIVEGKLDIVFFAGDGVEIWSPETVKQNGIGGSETMLMEMAKRLAKLGHRVRVYNSCGSHSGLYNGVEYLQTSKYSNLKCDVLVVSRRADALADQFNIQAKIKLLWVHDVCAINATNQNILKADRILALTNWHKNTIMNIHNVHERHVKVTRNGIDLKRFDKKIDRNKFKVINSSSPDRSWPILLDCWKQIKQKVPQAELHLFYGFKNWEYSAQYDKGQADLIVRLKKQIEDMASLGVVYHDRVSQDELAEHFLSAGVWAHPTWFTETSCITAMEAQAAGLRIVTSSIAALNETVADRGILLPGEWTSPQYQDRFINFTIDAMDSDDDSDRIERQEYAKTHFGLDQLALEWDQMFYDLIEEVKTNPIVPYCPTPQYRK